MLSLKAMEDFPSDLRGGILSIGNFDGFHKGHQALLGLAKSSTAQNRSLSVLSFRPHPMKILHPEREFKDLYPLEDCRESLQRFGVDAFVVEPFDLNLAGLSPEKFVERLVVNFRPAVIAVGDDFRFGCNRRGDVDLLRLLGQSLQFEVVVQPELQVRGLRVSSSTIRKFLSDGEVDKARDFLGRPFELRGLVVAGDGRGRSIGYPTANVNVVDGFVPKPGVYVTFLSVDSRRLKSVANVGYRPTFKSEHRDVSVEVHVLGADQDLYGKDVRVQFLKRLRPELKFSEVDELIEQIGLDVLSAERYFESAKEVDRN